MIDVNCLQPIFLGNQGENLARTLEFDVSSWLGQYPGAEIVMLVQRPEEDAPYIAVTQVENGVLRWTPTNADTAIAGTGKIMLRLILGEKVRKSAICTVFVAKSLDEPGDAPDPAQAWVDQVIDAANKAEEGAKALLEELEPRIPPADGTPGDVLTKTENGSEWKKIDGMLPVKDVQVAGNSVLADGIANVPIASEEKEGVIKAPLADGTSGIQFDNDNRPCVYAASEADITARQTSYRPLVPAHMDYAVKAAMCDGKGAAWTADEQKAAQERMGIDKPPVKDVQVAGSSVLVDGVANVPNVICIRDDNSIGAVNPPQNTVWEGLIGISKNTGKIILAQSTPSTINTRGPQFVGENTVDYAVKAAMCDGKGAAWTSDEQMAARERMGFDKAYEIIKSVTTTEDVNQVVISLDNDGNDFTLNSAIIFVEYGGSNNGSIYSLCECAKTGGGSSICAYDFMGYTAQNKYSAFCCFAENGYWNALSYLPKNMYLGREIHGLSADSFMKNSVFVVPHINRIRVYANTGAGTSQVPAGTKIDVWGVRANA